MLTQLVPLIYISIIDIIIYKVQQFIKLNKDKNSEAALDRDKRDIDGFHI